MLIHKVIRRCVQSYRRTEEKLLVTQLKHVGSDVRIEYPFTIGGGHMISIGDGSHICGGVRLQCYPELVENKNFGIKIGKNCFLTYNCSILAGADIDIGDNVLLASNVLIVSYNHGMDPISDTPYMDQPLNPAPVRIRNGAWIGEKTVILPGVTIGERAIVGAGSIVTGDVPDYCIAVGNPAKVIRSYSFEDGKWMKRL